jgi:hypothetical protein
MNTLNDITEISDWALLRIGGQNEELLAKAEADLIVAREAVDACKDRLTAARQAVADIHAEITRRDLDGFVAETGFVDNSDSRS